MIKKICILSILILACSCAQKESDSFNEKDKTNVIASVHKTLEDYNKNIEKLGLLGEFDYLDNSTEFFWVPPGYSEAISYDSVATILKQNAATFVSIQNSFESLRIIPLTRELATYTGRLRSIMKDTAGKTTMVTLAETGIVIKRGGSWKLLSGQTTVLNNTTNDPGSEEDNQD